ncbi:hypothetical protein GF339_01780 [candidate division KSB3 bacterium]|uniref:Uncharacterized protein n=1 Tax=candidate division KSB3 bacterium TaxID=2044937 RepID=A0A9D5Q4U5_9BACT|nr:hypothetical protein [candidate division KSB3 bacterium]MBD3323281.1 hypothetical protein [candidate division KSB3 bacterium]
MKTVLYLLILLLLIAAIGLVFVAPAGLALFQLASLEFPGEAIHEQLQALTTFSIVEAANETEAEHRRQVLTLTVTDENIQTMLANALSQQDSPFITITDVATIISPEALSLTLTAQYGLFGYGIFDATVFSEWAVKMVEALPEGGNGVAMKPLNIHTDHLYTVNLARLWRYLAHTAKTDGWLLLPSIAPLQLEHLTLDDHQISFSVHLESS